jgi:NADH-quinone oxidoreductase subunit L
MRMGGLRKHTPVTFWTMLFAALAISGIFPLAGFFSKDEILWSAWSRGHPFVWLFGFITAGLTAFYMFRLIFLAFFGEGRYPEEVRHHLHESPSTMTSPLIVLGVLSVIGGFIGLPAWMEWLGSNRFFHFLEPSLAYALSPEYAEASHAAEFGFAVLSVAMACAGIYLAYRFYIRNPKSPAELAGRWKGIHRVLLHKYYVDELYDAAIIKPTVQASANVLWKQTDAGLIDGAVNGTGQAIQSFASVLKNIQNGLIRSYAAWILLGMAAVLLYIYVFSRGY